MFIVVVVVTAIVFLTDGQRIDQKEQNRTKQVIRKYCDKLEFVSVFILYAYSEQGKVYYTILRTITAMEHCSPQ